MTNEECHLRAAQCAAKASVRADTSIGLEFLVLAAQWRAMAVRKGFLGYADRPLGRRIAGPTDRDQAPRPLTSTTLATYVLK
jgi:hypothetical protein